MEGQNETLYDRIDNVVMKVLRVISYGAVLFLILIMLMAFFNVIGEKMGKAGIVGFRGIRNSNYWIQYWHIPTVYLTMGYVVLSSGHTKIDFVTRRYPRILQEIMGVLANLIAAGITGFVAWRGWTVLLAEQIRYGSTINGLSQGFPEWPFGLSYCLGMTLTALAFLWAIVRILTGHSETKREPKAEHDDGGQQAGVMD